MEPYPISSNESHVNLQNTNTIIHFLTDSFYITIEIDSHKLPSHLNSNKILKLNRRVMAHSMISPPTTVTTPITTTRSKHQQPPSLGFLRVSASSCRGSAKTQDDKFINRRSVTLSLAAGVVVVGLSGGQSEAAGRRPPPPPAEEKKDPNVSGVQAKVLASKKRKEAMKESVAKLREKGKSINN